MKQLIFSLITLLAFSFSLTAQDSDFEGIVKIKNNAGQGYNGTITKKGDRTLMETTTSEGKLYLLSENTSGDLITVTEKNGEKMGIKTNLKTNPYLQQMQKMESYEKRANDSDVKITVTDDTRMIRGYLCTKVIGEDDESKGEAWVATKLKLNMADLVPSSSSFLKGKNPVYDLTGIEGFIMEMTMKNKKTGEEHFMENEVIEKKIDDSVFTSVTAGVDILDTTDMQKMIQEAAKDPKKMEQFKEMMKQYQKGNN